MANSEVFNIFGKVAYPNVKFDEKHDGAVAQEFWGYALILCKNRAQSHQKWCNLNFDDKFEFSDLKNSRKRGLFKTEQVR